MASPACLPPRTSPMSITRSSPKPIRSSSGDSQKQDIDKVRFLLNEAGSDNSMVDELPNLGPGQFQMVAPDVAPSPAPSRSDGCTRTMGPLTEEQVEEVTGDALRAWAEARSRRRKRRRVPGQRAPMLRLSVRQRP